MEKESLSAIFVFISKKQNLPFIAKISKPSHIFRQSKKIVNIHFIVMPLLLFFVHLSLLSSP